LPASTQANAFQHDTIPLSSLLPSGSNPSVFARYITTRERNALRSISSDESGTEVRIHGTNVEVTAKSKAALASAVDAAKKFLEPLAKGLEFDSVEIPQALHGHIVGKGGAGVARLRTKIDEALGTEGALVDVVIPHRDDEGEDEADEIVVVVKRGLKAMEAVKGEVMKQIETMVGLGSSCWQSRCC
jgi:hypothetical protein